MVGLESKEKKLRQYIDVSEAQKWSQVLRENIRGREEPLKIRTFFTIL